MTHSHIEELDPIKLPLIQKLYKAHYPAGKAKSSELIYVSYTGTQISGVVRIRSIDQWRLLTGMLVAPEFREKGIAHQLMQYCENHVLAEHDYCFAYAHLENFYSQHGFKALLSEGLPAQLRTLFERYSRSGKTLIPMKYQIRDNI